MIDGAIAGDDIASSIVQTTLIDDFASDMHAAIMELKKAAGA